MSSSENNDVQSKCRKLAIQSLKWERGPFREPGTDRETNRTKDNLQSGKYPWKGNSHPLNKVVAAT
jgi:hypothetical protein